MTDAEKAALLAKNGLALQDQYERIAAEIARRLGTDADEFSVSGPVEDLLGSVGFFRASLDYEPSPSPERLRALADMIGKHAGEVARVVDALLDQVLDFDDDRKQVRAQLEKLDADRKHLREQLEKIGKKAFWARRVE
jgi:hypothetical protein